MYNAGLVLEGGGMRGVYTTGVLDFFLDKGIEFKNCIGVSAGAVHCCSYLSKQKGRAYHVVVDSINDKRYASTSNLIKTGFFFGKDYNLNIVPKQLFPYDYEAYANCGSDFYACVTNVETGEAEYQKIEDMDRDIEAIWASGSLPLMAKLVPIGDKKYLDGGVADSIPIKKSKDMGFDKNVVILTREAKYRKEPTGSVPLIRLRYPGYPKIAEAMKNRHIEYNETLEYIEELESKGEVFVIRPSEPLAIGRLEKNKERLQEIYKIGYADAEKAYEQMIEYLDK
ncbi:MAG: patatin family protein [Lachnospiraceae bacterium]|nr:patatin family protein [Lachnospiraceae bacterium]